MTKEQARRLVGSRKKQLEPLYIEQANQSIFQKLIQMEEYQQAETIFCYVSTAEEVNTWPVIGHALECGKSDGQRGNTVWGYSMCISGFESSAAGPWRRLL